MLSPMALLAVFTLAAVIATPSHGEAATRVQTGDTAARGLGPRMAAGGLHTCAIKGDGTVRCWGANDFGQLGDGTTTARSTPVTVSGLVRTIAVAAGNRHSCALLADGTVRCWGRNNGGQLGDGTTTDRLVSVPVSGLTQVVALAAGLNHTCALRADGTARCWGFNGTGQLGDGTTTVRLTPVAVSGVTQAVALAAGSTHTCALRSDGTARCWGFNDFGQIGDGTSGTNRLTSVAVSGLTQAVALAGGDHYTCALRVNGTAACWGRNDSGQIGDGTSGTNRLTPVTVSGLSDGAALTTGASHTCVRRANGTAVCWGENGTGQVGDGTAVDRLLPVPVTGLPGDATVVLAAGNLHTCALQDEDTAHCWGSGNGGQLGNGTTTGSFTPVVVAGGGGSISGRAMAGGAQHTCARRANGTAACWGRNHQGQLGDGTTTTRLLPVAVSGVTGAVFLSASLNDSCAVHSDGDATCWGTGGLGPGLTSGLVPASGTGHTCVALANGTVRCWGGTNLSGQLGDGTTIGKNAPDHVAVSGLTDAVAVTAGAVSTCALRVNGTAVCWGSNAFGQLGDGTVDTDRLTPVAVSGLTDAVALAAGSFHTCALRASGTVVCWGANNLGQVGDGTVQPRLSPVAVGGGLTDVVGLAAGTFHTCALRASGTVTCWGDNGSGQLGDGTTTSRLVPTTSVIGARGVLTLDGIVTIAAGSIHTCALRADGQPFCWGDNDFGQLGDGTTLILLKPVEVSSFRFNIDPAVELSHQGRRATVTALVNCPEGEYFWAHLSLAQGSIIRHGFTVGACTGGLARYPVQVIAGGRGRFTAGPGQAAADATVLSGGEVVDTQEWTRAVQMAFPE